MKTLTLILTALVLTSCGTLHKTKNIQTSTAAMDSHATTNETRKAKAHITTTTKEKVDTNVTLPSTSIKTTGTIDALENGDTIETDADGMNIRIYRNGKKVVAEATQAPKSIPIYIEKETTQEADMETNDTKNTNVDVKASDTETVKHEDIQKSDWHLPWWLWLLLICGAFLAVMKVYWRFWP